ncbi:hypothetical protein SAY87_001792 [Trapa incisa]|uniref:Protein kinase domain-containing protein n=1 Tax=Trapa incisa TaxID=236973 RepID=A0AAN7JT58_9MYRT|nr:hypothetical protein SAY87_001792 [Trapa incisa]
MNNGFTGMRSFTYKELEEATSGFKEKLGQGAFGAVYRGALPSSLRGMALVAVKVLEKSCDFEMVDEARMVLSDWVYDCYHEDRLDEIVVGDEEAAEDMKRVRRFVMIAMWCIQEDPSLRPPMKKVTQMLDGAVEVAIPPEPSSFISSL